jgi:non-heme chloroperoxidase
MFHHGWPLSADDWDAQTLFFLDHGYRVVAHDRRGHGRSAQVGDGHDMDHYAADAAAVVQHLDLRDAVHVGHSTGGEAARYVARHGQGRVAKLVLISAVPPLMLETPANPGGLPIEVFDGFRMALADNRAKFYVDVAAGAFYGFNRPEAKPIQAVIDSWWRQGMMGGAKAHYDGIKAFSETEFTDDLKAIEAPTLVMHGDDDQIVPYADAALLSVKLLRNATLKIYEKFPHGMCTTHADVINPDLLAFIKGRAAVRRAGGVPFRSATPVIGALGPKQRDGRPQTGKAGYGATIGAPLCYLGSRPKAVRSSFFAASRTRRCDASRFLPARLM